MRRIQRSDLIDIVVGSLKSERGNGAKYTRFPCAGNAENQVFCTTILGKAALWSCCFSAIFTATRRAMRR